jgi:hypothetical protein
VARGRRPPRRVSGSSWITSERKEVSTSMAKKKKAAKKKKK